LPTVVSKLSNVNVLRCRNESDILKHIPFAAQAAFNSSDKQHDPFCLPNTRVDVLRQIRAWADGRDEQCIFWLSGWAGTGKSTIARTVACEYRDRGYLGASFFFSRGKEDVSYASKFFTSIAVQLTEKSPVLGDLIRKAISSNPNIASQVRRDQWKLLILEPLSKLEAGSLQEPLILVIDALDECDGDNDIRGILELLSEAETLETIQLRIFVTSRPETPIRLGFHKMPRILHYDLILHEIPR
jgi:NACHT domain